MIKLSDLFDIEYGTNLELNKLKLSKSKNAINFVSRTSKNNGVSAKVKKVDTINPQPAGTITVASGGSILSAFVQKKPFYSGRDLYVLYPKRNMLFCEKQFYAMCIKENKYRYSYGRQANKTLKNLELPDKIPDWVYKYKVNYDALNTKIDSELSMVLNYSEWRSFRIGDLFSLKNGIKYPKEIRVQGELSLISTTAENNGVSDKIKYRDGVYNNILTVAYSGSVGATFYHERDVFVGETVFALIPKFKLNKYIGMFLCTIFRHFNKKYDYGRKIIGSKYINEEIKLPATTSKPNWSFMENYIKSLPYGDKI